MIIRPLIILLQCLIVLFSSYGLASSTPIQTRNQSRASSNPQLVTAQTLKGTTSEIPNYRKYNIDPSKTILTIGGVDFTGKAVIVPNPNNTENLLVTLVLPEPLKALANLEFKLSTETKEGVKAESSSFANVVAKIGIAPIHLIKIPSYDSILEDATIKTPVSVFEHGAVNILYQEGDKLENFVVNVPVFALDEKGMPVNVDVSNLSLSGLSSGVTSGSTTMTAGLAVVPLTITSSNPDMLKLEVSTANVDGGTRSATRVSTRNPLAVLAIPVVVIAAEDVAGLFIGLGIAIGDLLHPTPPQQPYADWVGTQESFGDLSYPINQFPPVVGGSCAPGLFSFPGILASSEHESIDVPLNITISPNFKVFGDCKNQLLNWKPPAKGSDKYNEIKNRIENKVDGDGKSIFDSGSASSPGRAEISKIEGDFAPQDYATSGRTN